jgi:hypothetical protein
MSQMTINERVGQISTGFATAISACPHYLLRRVINL